MSCRWQIRGGYFEKAVLNMFVLLVHIYIYVWSFGLNGCKNMKSTKGFF